MLKVERYLQSRLSYVSCVCMCVCVWWVTLTIVPVSRRVCAKNQWIQLDPLNPRLSANYVDSN